ncbi:hypothetical protein WJX73_001585 [Symbiochloris irregularis]|uniref:DNA repair protein RadA n=1 Tax=Symbiochloris irregularis TaxID=706552 RepID=A0AAW1PZR1_9CHLO
MWNPLSDQQDSANGRSGILYVSGEESADQVASRVIGSAGSVAQVRECATALLRKAKTLGIPILLVGHMNKAGDMAGPRMLEHVVDVVLMLEGERYQSFRLLRATKNRHASTDELGVFQMLEEGLMPVADPSVLFVSNRSLAPGLSGAVTVTMEGTRPMLVEIQALCSAAGKHQAPYRTANGLSRGRLSLILAALSKHAGLQLHSQDLHINVVGGMAVKEPAADLAMAMAVASSDHDQPIKTGYVFLGEIGLGGELRSVPYIERRIREAAKLGPKRTS